MVLNSRQFVAYHPYLTYSDRKTYCFVDIEGKSRGDLDSDTEALFRIGRKTYDLLAPEWSREEFDQRYVNYLKTVDEWRVALFEKYKAMRFKFVGTIEDPFAGGVTEIEDYQVVWFLWQMSSSPREKTVKEHERAKKVIREVLLFYALREVDNAIVALQLDGGAVIAAIEAAESLSNAIAIELGNEQLTKARRQLAYQGAIERIKRDPKQREKLFVRECWLRWQSMPSEYSSKAAFARDMLTKCEHLTSQKKIEDWCREWESKNRTQPA